MQLINNLNDLQKYFNVLKPELKERLISDIDYLINKYLDEQTEEQGVPAILPSPESIEETKSAAIKNLQASITRPAGTGQLPALTPPPPPVAPPPPVMQTPPPAPGINPFTGRGIGSRLLNVKPVTGSSKAPGKKKFVSIFDSLGYITPLITDFGAEAMKNPNTASDIYQFLKNVDNKTSLKQLQIMYYPGIPAGKILEKVFLISKERFINLKKSFQIPEDEEILMRLGDLLISMGKIDEAALDKALEAQKNYLTQPATGGEMNWMDKAKAMIPENTSKKKPLLGDTLVSLKMITQNELELALAIQRWFKHVLESR